MGLGTFRVTSGNFKPRVLIPLTKLGGTHFWTTTRGSPYCGTGPFKPGPGIIFHLKLWVGIPLWGIFWVPSLGTTFHTGGKSVGLGIGRLIPCGVEQGLILHVFSLNLTKLRVGTAPLGNFLIRGTTFYWVFSGTFGFRQHPLSPTWGGYYTSFTGVEHFCWGKGFFLPLGRSGGLQNGFSIPRIHTLRF